MMFFRAECRIAAENTFGLVDCMVTLSTTGMFHLSNSTPASRSIHGTRSPGDRHQHIVAFNMLVRLASRDQAAATLGIVGRLHFLEDHAGQLAALDLACFGHHEIEDGNAFVDRIFLFPRAGFHLLVARTHDDLDVLAPRRLAERQQSIAVLPPPSTMTRLPILSMCPNDTLASQSMPTWDVFRALGATGDVEVTAARRAGADEHAS